MKVSIISHENAFVSRPYVVKLGKYKFEFIYRYKTKSSEESCVVNVSGRGPSSVKPKHYENIYDFCYEIEDEKLKSDVRSAYRKWLNECRRTVRSFSHEEH